jgi:hypothetical protein
MSASPDTKVSVRAGRGLVLLAFLTACSASTQPSAGAPPRDLRPSVTDTVQTDVRIRQATRPSANWTGIDWIEEAAEGELLFWSHALLSAEDSIRVSVDASIVVDSSAPPGRVTIDGVVAVGGRAPQRISTSVTAGDLTVLARDAPSIARAMKDVDLTQDMTATPISLAAREFVEKIGQLPSLALRQPSTEQLIELTCRAPDASAYPPANGLVHTTALLLLGSVMPRTAADRVSSVSPGGFSMIETRVTPGDILYWRLAYSTADARPSWFPLAADRPDGFWVRWSLGVAGDAACEPFEQLQERANYPQGVPPTVHSAARQNARSQTPRNWCVRTQAIAAPTATYRAITYETVRFTGDGRIVIWTDRADQGAGTPPIGTFRMMIHVPNAGGRESGCAMGAAKRLPASFPPVFDPLVVER